MRSLTAHVFIERSETAFRSDPFILATAVILSLRL